MEKYWLGGFIAVRKNGRITEVLREGNILFDLVALNQYQNSVPYLNFKRHILPRVVLVNLSQPTCLGEVVSEIT